MERKHYHILIISSYPPSRSGGIVQDIISGFEGEGHTVDFFTMYAFPGQKSNYYSIYPEPVTGKLSRLKQKYPFLGVFKRIAKVFLKTPEEKMTSVKNHGYRIPHYEEAVPPVNNDILVKALPDKRYDFIMTFVTERMITTPSFVAIYNKYKVPNLIDCMDMMHFTGGCYFFGECRRFAEGCGKCLVLDSNDENDQTHKNYLIKSKVYPQIQYGIICNLHQRQFALQCGLFEPSHIFTVSMWIDEDVFVPMDFKECRSSLGIPEKVKFVILSRYVPGMDRAKGYDHLVNIINKVYDALPESNKGDITLVLIGSKDNGIAKQVRMNTISLGFLNLTDLIKSYSASNVFISTSIDDAGPSMVNQSMMCGTPTVTFKIGTALQVTREGINGYSANNFDDDEFASYILDLYKKTESEYAKMREDTRQSALEMNSKSSNARRMVEIYEEVKKLYKD